MNTMSKVALVLAPVLFAACVDNGAAGPEAPTPTSPVAFAQLDADGTATIATGGVQIVSIADPLAVGLAGSATDGYELAPTTGGFPNGGLGEYRVRALTDANGAFSIETAKGIAAGQLASAPVERVAVVPSKYHLDGRSAFALDASRTDIEVQLFSADGRRLVDGSLAIAGATQTAWDRGTVTGATLTITADSFATESVNVTFATSVDHIDQVVEGGRTCFHAYAGNVEVATTIPNIVNPDPAATNCEL